MIYIQNSYALHISVCVCIYIYIYIYITVIQLYICLFKKLVLIGYSNLSIIHSMFSETCHFFTINYIFQDFLSMHSINISFHAMSHFTVYRGT